MLGEKIAELKGKVTDHRVLDSQGSTETTITFDSTYREIPSRMYVTFVGRPSSEKGVIQGKGQGVVLAGESDVATFTAQGRGKITSSGGAKWRGAHFFGTTNGGLAFLNNVIRLFEGDMDAEGNDITKIWEWK